MFEALITRHDFRGNRHQAVEYNGMLFVGGIVAADSSLDMAGQTRQILGKLDKVLADAGSNRDRLLFVLISITDMSLKPEMNRVWLEWFAPDKMPARATFGISAIEEGVLIEIVAIAAKNKS